MGTLRAVRAAAGPSCRGCWRSSAPPVGPRRSGSSRGLAVVPTQAGALVKGLASVTRDAWAADAAIRCLRADAALLEAAIDGQRLALRETERALARLFVEAARGSADGVEEWLHWQQQQDKDGQGEGAGEMSPPPEQPAPQQQREARQLAAQGPAGSAGRWLGDLGGLVSSAASTAVDATAWTISTAVETTTSTASAAARAAAPTLYVATAAGKSIVGLDTFAAELAQQQERLAALSATLSAHFLSGGSGDALQEVLVARAKSLGLLTLEVTAEVQSDAGESCLAVGWETAWPADRVGAWRLTLVGRTPLESRVHVADVQAERRSYLWRPDTAERRRLTKTFSGLIGSAVSGVWVEVEACGEGARVSEPDGVGAAGSKAVGRFEDLYRG